MSAKKSCLCYVLVLIGLGATVAMGVETHTGSPCFGIADNSIIWCENFDTYCVGGNAWEGYPPFPTVCPDGSSTPDDTAYLTNWLKPFNCGILWWDRTHVVEESCAWGFNRDFNPPFSLKYEGCLDNTECGPLPYNLASSRHVMSMADAINDQWPGASGVNGTDANPLKLRFHMDHNTKDDGMFRGGDSANANFYVELCKDNDRAPTDVTWVDCSSNYTTNAIYPIICQQRARTAIPTPGFLGQCPPLSTDTHASIAVGMLAILDNIPCDVENGSRPTMYHMAFFDGLKWWDMRQGIGTPGNGDFVLNDGGDSWFELWVRTSTIYIKFTWEHCCAVHPECYDGLCTKTQIVSEVLMPRAYTGGFNQVAFGMGEGCDLDGATYTCTGPYKCFTYGSYNDGWGWGPTWIDSLVVYHGVGEPPCLCTDPVVVSAMSVKTHGDVGDFGIDVLDTTDKQDFEPRLGGVTKLVVGFDQSIQRLNDDLTDISLSSGLVTSISVSGFDLTVEMTGTTNGVPLTVSFPGIATAGCANCVSTDSVCVRQLIGNISTADLAVNSADRVEVRDLVGLAVGAGTFRGDLNVDGSINSADRTEVRDAVGTGFSGSCP